MYEVEAAAFGGLFLILTVCFVVILVFMSVFSLRRTYNYRKGLADLYIAGKIRTIAKADDIDLAEEYETYKKWEKKGNLWRKDLDETIEEDLKEKVSEPLKKK